MNRPQFLLGSMVACLGATANSGEALGFQSAANASCQTAQTIEGEGLFAFDNTGPLAADAPANIACGDHAYPQFLNDLWYCWTATCDGDVTVDTCGTTIVDTKLEVASGCDCASRVILGCNDNTLCGMQSQVTFSAAAGERYLIRLATSSADFVAGGTGQFTIRCAPPVSVPCRGSEFSCFTPDAWNAFASDRLEFVAAQRFTPAESGEVSRICWAGLYFDGKGDCSAGAADSFEVRYYADAGGVPGGLVAGPFAQLSGTLDLSGPARSNRFVSGLAHEFDYYARHDPVAVEANGCYWVEISNSLATPCTWMWGGSYASAGHAVQDGRADTGPDGYDLFDAISEDLTICTNLAASIELACQPPANDLCINATPIFEGETTFSCIGAMTDGGEEYPTCTPCCYFPYGDRQIHQDVWFDYEATCSGLFNIEARGSAFDAKIAVYEGPNCPSPSRTDALACNDELYTDDPSFSHVSFHVNQGQRYKIRVGGYRDQEGTGVLALSYCRPPGTDCSDDCSHKGDLNCDGAVTTTDYPPFSLCLSGPCSHTLDGQTYVPLCLSLPCGEAPCRSDLADGCCRLADLDEDGDRDLRDFAQFQATVRR